MGCGASGASAPVQQSDPTNPGNPTTPQIGAVATYHNDNGRSGVYPLETSLTPANVNVVSFGKLAAIPLEGEVYAQPLYVPSVPMSDGQNHNLVIVATEHDQVYAIDSTTFQVMWHTDFLNGQGAVTTVPAQDTNCGGISNEVGITGTPVIDTAAGIVYVLVRTKEMVNGQVAYYQRLHKLSLSTGQNELTRAVTTPSAPAFGSAQFDPLLNMQRSALLLSNNRVYVAWASHCDFGNYTGWLMSFDAASLSPSGAWTPDPSGTFGGIWMSGSGPATDQSGDIYLVVGNGWTDVMSGGENYGDSVVRLTPSFPVFAVTDYFTPFDFDQMFNEDLDLGSGGALLFPDQGSPHPHLMTVAGKDGTVYLLDRDNLGHWHDGDDGQVVQTFQSDTSRALSSPVFWNNQLYFSFSSLPLQAFAFDPGAELLNPTPVSNSQQIAIGYPGATPSISANGSNDAVLWILQTDQYYLGTSATLRAFDPKDLSVELYDSTMSPQRDSPGGAIKFAVPTVAGGEVFVGAHNELDIYGLLPN